MQIYFSMHSQRRSQAEVLGTPEPCREGRKQIMTIMECGDPFGIAHCRQCLAMKRGGPGADIVVIVV
jgi:hypothetical protein